MVKQQQWFQPEVNESNKVDLIAYKLYNGVMSGVYEGMEELVRMDLLQASDLDRARHIVTAKIRDGLGTNLQKSAKLATSPVKALDNNYPSNSASTPSNGAS